MKSTTAHDGWTWICASARPKVISVKNGSISAVTTVWHTNLPGNDATNRLNGENSS
jgi:hypothetical protein